MSRGNAFNSLIIRLANALPSRANQHCPLKPPLWTTTGTLRSLFVIDVPRYKNSSQEHPSQLQPKSSHPTISCPAALCEQTNQPAVKIGLYVHSCIVKRLSSSLGDQKDDPPPRCCPFDPTAQPHAPTRPSLPLRGGIGPNIHRQGSQERDLAWL